MDDHSCVVRRWDREAWGDDFLSSSTSGSSQPVINVLTNELNRVNIRLKDSQRRLFDVERSIISQRSPESSTNNEGNTSINEYNKIRSNAWVQSGVSPTGEMATCIHEMNHCRARSKSLSDELNRLKKSPTVAPSVMCFTRHRGEEETILASSLIRVLPVDVDDPTCVITEAEAASIEKEAGALRVELQQQLGRANDHLQSLMTELHCLQTYNEELEARTTLCQDAFLQMANLGASKETPRMPSASTFENIEQLRDEVEGTVQWDWQQNEPQRRGKAVTTRHTVDFPWSGADILVENKPEELMATFSMEVARGLGAPPHCVSNVTFHASPMGLTAKFDVHHPVNLPGSQVDALLRDYGFPYLQHLHLGADGPKKGLDFAIEEVCRVLGIQEGKYNGLRFDEFVEQLQEINMSTDKDAYESEVGDMLILMDKLHNENRSLHHALAKSNAEIRKQTAETQREREELKKRTSELYREIKRLNDVLAKLRELADSQEEELQQYKLEKAHIQHVRTQRHLDKEEYHDKDIYCITLQEYIKEQGRVARLQQEIQEEERKNQERLCTLQEQNQQLKTLMEEKTKEMDELQLELRVFRQKRRDSQAVRVQDGLLTTDASPKFASEQNSETVHPHVLANEPLFSVTLEELNEIRNTNVKLAEEMVQKAGIIRN
ncbi:hypothetical protein TcBrA4_0047150 [Trypanosoma cruzi]|nr:hypothetical protein TcBrA4_0047150 [Trypanosoma cruzi]